MYKHLNFQAEGQSLILGLHLLIFMQVSQTNEIY